MSRTKHHRNQKKQHQGRDLWSRRPLASQSYCTENKLMCRQKERAMAKQQTHNLVKVFININF